MASDPDPATSTPEGPLPAEGGTLVLAGTPLGNPQDAAPRLIGLLLEADLVACEDSRRLARLLADLGHRRTGPVISFHDDDDHRLARMLRVLDEGGTVALVTDAGMPSISDPGYRAVRAALDAGHPVTCVPGPSAVTTALALSGLACHRFCFEGFLPRRGAERRARLAAMAHEPRTQVYFEAPHRLAATLTDMVEAFGPARPAAACRELSKRYEEVLRLPLGGLAAWAQEGVRGEITLVVAGADPAPAPDARQLAQRVAALESDGATRKEAIIEVARSTGTPRREVFDAVVAARTA